MCASFCSQGNPHAWSAACRGAEGGGGRPTTAQRSASEALPQARAASLRHSLPELALPLATRADPACSPLADGLLASARSGSARSETPWSCYHTADSEVNAAISGKSAFTLPPLSVFLLCVSYYFRTLQALLASMACMAHKEIAIAADTGTSRRSSVSTSAAGRLRNSLPVHALLLSAAPVQGADEPLSSARSGAATGRAGECMSLLRRSLALGASPLRAAQTAREARPATWEGPPAATDASSRCGPTCM